jgi:hypothetical protein
MGEVSFCPHTHVTTLEKITIRMGRGRKKNTENEKNI